MEVQSGVEVAVLTDRRKPFIRADMLRQLSAEKIPERAACKARKEIACEDAESIRRAELGKGLLDITSGWPEEAR